MENRKEINRRYYEKNKEKQLAKKKMQYKKDPDKFRKRCKAWRKNNPEKTKAVDKKYSQSDKGVINQRKKGKKYYEKYKDNILLQSKNYRNTEEGKIKNKESQNKYHYKNQEKISIKNKMQYKKDPDKFCKRGQVWRDNNLYDVHVAAMYESIKKRCKNRYGLIGKTKYHIEGFGWVYPPINGGSSWRWDGVTRKN